MIGVWKGKNGSGDLAKAMTMVQIRDDHLDQILAVRKSKLREILEIGWQALVNEFVFQIWSTFMADSYSTFPDF